MNKKIKIRHPGKIRAADFIRDLVSLKDAGSRLKAGMTLVMLGMASVMFSSSPAYAAVQTGIDVLVKEGFKPIDGARVALITNQTGRDRQGMSTVELLHEAENVQLVCILSPEHGFRGTVRHGEKVKDGVDPETGVPIYSLYGKTKRPTEDMLKGVDTIVYDIQDVGVRFYTYITTMGQALQEAAKRKLRFVVLDRPNPIRGDILEGDVLDSRVRRFTGYFTIPVRYGLTPGELARWFNDSENLEADLTVIKMKNWKRRMWFSQTRLPFHPPSPNIPRLTSALLYPGIGCFEATNVSVGRGTDQPFELFGAPWINGPALCAALRQRNFPGFLFEPVTFTPKKDMYKGQACHGVRIVITNRQKARPFQVFLAAFYHLIETHPDQFKPVWDEIRVVTGSDRLKAAVETSTSLTTLLDQYAKTLTDFKNQISSFYLYQ